MAEYINVEKPFLQKLRELNWEIIDHGAGFIPQDPTISFRSSFREVILEGVFRESIKRINKTEDGREWVTDKQVDDILRELTNNSGMGILEVNKKIHELLTKKTTVPENELTGEKNPVVQLIEFKTNKINENSFIAINQFRIDTPGGARQAIIPDIVLFVNGLPLVVIECKDEDVAQPLSEAFNQITRYANIRDDDYGISEGEERLFHSNLITLITHGTEARFGTITGEFEHYLNWKDIFPEKYNVVAFPPQEERQEVLIHGMLNKEILLDILKNFTVFMEVKKGQLAKIVCRYQQYRAVGKMIDGLLQGKNSFEKGGVVWHTQGSGKSLTMVFLVKKIRTIEELKHYKIIFINDRTDLEDQLSETAGLTGESVNIIAHRRDLKDLETDTSDLNMVMIHKFLTNNGVSAQSLIDSGVVPHFEPFSTINDSDRILILIDEAHRTQGGEMGDNLFVAFPNAVKIAFTGTPLLTERHKQKTHERFGSFVDTYKMKEAVADRATVDILYIGRTSKDHILNKEQFKEEFEDMFRSRTVEERQEIQRRYGTLTAYLESKDRIKKIAEDMIEHYTSEIMPNGMKAQVVACSIVAACRYKYEIENAIKNKITQEKSKPDGERDDELIKQMEFLNVAAVVTMMDNNEPGYISAARRQAKEINAIENFKKEFDYNKSETGVAILCVCDRLLTGFDAPIEQVMYLDKNLREHDLMQAIARVNRTKVLKSGYVKEHGIVVDYFGVAQHLKDALAVYSEEDEKELSELSEYFRGIDKEVPVLETRYNRLLQLFQGSGIKDIKDFVEQKMVNEKDEWELVEECIQLAKEVKFRAQFDTYIKAFFDSLDLLFNASIARDYYIPAKRFGYLLMRIRNRYKDHTLDLKWAGAKVRKLLDKYLESEGITSKIDAVGLLSEDFPKKVNELNKTSKAKASEMEHAIRWHIKINISKDPAFYTKFDERLQRIMNEHKEHWDVITTELVKMRQDMAKGRKKESNDVPEDEAPFYDLINLLADIPKEDTENIVKVKELTSSIFTIVKKYLSIPNLWRKPFEMRQFESEIRDEIEYSGIDGISKKAKHITTETIVLAKNREKEIKK